MVATFVAKPASMAPCAVGTRMVLVLCLALVCTPFGGVFGSDGAPLPGGVDVKDGGGGGEAVVEAQVSPNGVTASHSDQSTHHCGDNTAIPLAFVNDDYCDCADGSDETETSACSHTGVMVRAVCSV